MPQLNAYLSFRDSARAAMEFYRDTFGGELALDTFGSMDPNMDASDRDLIMHAQLDTADGFTLMASDTPSFMPYEAPAGISLSLSGDEEGALRGWWDALATDGTITQPLVDAPWGGQFGMLTDRFGINWMVAINPAE